MTTDLQNHPLVRHHKKQLLLEALLIAHNSVEYDGDRTKADAIALLIEDIKHTCFKCGKVDYDGVQQFCRACYYGIKEA